MFRLAPWADVLYASDLKWWQSNDWAAGFEGLKIGLDVRLRRHADKVGVLEETGSVGLETRPWGLRNGGSSGYHAINLAVHFGARRILLLGYDYQPGVGGAHHCHPEHDDRRYLDYRTALEPFGTLPAPLRTVGVSVLNCTRETALYAFPRVTLEAALDGES